MTIWSWLSGYGTHLYENFFTTSVFAVVMLIWAATNFCVLFQRASGGRISMPACTVFSACMVSYPLMNEIWGDQGANLIICGGFLLVSSIVSLHFLSGALYFPVGMFVIAAVVLIVLMIVQFVRKQAFSGLLVLGMLFSTEALSLLQGIASPYRACQVFAVCVAFVGLMAANRLRFKNIAAFALCFLCLHQSIYMSRLNVLNDMRYEEEIAVAEQIATELNRGHDLDKPVIFVGEYQISDAIMSQITVPADSACYQAMNGFQETLHRLVPAYPNVPVEQTFPVTNVQSLIRWSTKAFRGQNQMGALLARCGCTVRTVDELYGGILESAESYAIEREMPAYPNEGYIAELDQAIIVKLGEEYLLHES